MTPPIAVPQAPNRAQCEGVRKTRPPRDAMPPSVLETMAQLQAARGPLSAQLDAIDLALENLRRVWPVRAGPATASRVTRRRLRVVAPDSAAAQRRGLLLTAITDATAGLTGSQLRRQFPTISSKDQSNALQKLKAAKQIRRSGQAWVGAA